MYQPVTFETALALAQGISPKLIAEADGVKPNTIHQRRIRFDRYVGGQTPRVGKRGRPKKSRDCIGQKLFGFWQQQFN